MLFPKRKIFFHERATKSWVSSTKPKEQELLKTANEVYKILNISFWIHGIVLITNGISQKKNDMKIFVSLCFALLIDGIMLYHLLAVYIYYKDISKIAIDVTVETCFFILGLIQRCVFYCRQTGLISILIRLSRLHSPIFSNSKMKLKWKLFVIIVASDAMIILILVVFFCPLIFSTNTGISHKFNMTNIIPEELIYAREFCVFWKKMNMSVAIYFCAICFILRETLIVLKECAGNINFKNEFLIGAYNEMLDITKEANDSFSLMLFLGIVMTLSSIFYHAYNYVFNEADMDHIKIFRVLVLFYEGFCLFLICFSASSVTNHASDAQYEIEKAANEYFFEKEVYPKVKLNSHYFGFTILDSITIDRSLLFSATGVLLTYGVMIATFSMSSA